MSTATINTKFGDINIEFYPKQAPNHVKNFIKLAKDGYYNETTFHRIIPGFMAQGGCPNTKPGAKGMPGTGGPGHTVNAEFNPISHKRGILSMARSNDPNSAGSQFFIVHGDSTFLDNNYTVFGKVTSGMEFVDKIVEQPRNGSDLPDERIQMTVAIKD
jgi:peptidyl-prolyl cis-trans isomerase B (cyclophilin B)